jgi:hypothetical protein
VELPRTRLNATSHTNPALARNPLHKKSLPRRSPDFLRDGAVSA